MSPRRTRRGTILKESADEASVNISTKSLTKSVTRRRNTRRPNKSQAVKSSEEDSDSQVEVNSLVDNTIDYLNELSATKRKRRVKTHEASSVQESVSSVVIDEPKTKVKPKKVSQKITKTPKATKTHHSEVANYSMISEDDSFSAKNQKENNSSEKNNGIPTELDSLTNNIAHILNEVPTTTKIRKRKVQELSSVQNSSLSVTLDDSKTKLRSKKTKATKTPQLTKTQQLEIVSNSLISEDDSFNAKSNKKKKRVSYNDEIMTEDEDILEKKSKKKNKSSKQTASSKKKVKITAVSLTKNESSNDSNTSVEKSTPKSSPMKLVLSPHRSKKTPKKSPMNLGSPKTHSHNSFKMLNVPRKLSIDISPNSSDEVNQSTQQTNLEVNETYIGNTIEKKESVSKQKSPVVKINGKVLKSPRVLLSPKLKNRSMEKISSKTESIASQENSSNQKSPGKSEKKTSGQTSSETFEGIDLTKEISSHRLVDTSKLNNSSKKKISSSKQQSNKSQNTSRKSSSFLSHSKRLSKTFVPKKMPKIFLKTKNSKTKKPLLKLSKSLSPTKTKVTQEKSSKTITPSKLKSNKSSNSTSLSTSLPLSKTQDQNTRPTVATSSTASSTSNPRVVLKKISSSLRKSPLKEKKDQAGKNVALSDDKDTSSVEKFPKLLKVSMSKVIHPKIPAENVNFVSNTPAHILEKKLMSLKPKNTSTPREKTKRTLGINKNMKNCSVILKATPITKTKAIKRLNNQSKLSKGIRFLEDESEPSLSESSLMHMSKVFESDNSKNGTFDVSKDNSNTLKERKQKNSNNDKNADGTFEIDTNSSNATNEKNNKKDGTYELDEPKTPALKKNVMKRTGKAAGLDRENEHDNKKNCKVSFAPPAIRNHIQSAGINRIGTPRPPPRQETSFLNDSMVAIGIEKKGTSITSSFKKTPIKSGTNENQPSTPIDAKSKKITYDAQVASVNRLSKPKATVTSEKKLEPKSLIARKIPNFAEIHQKRFEKMESIVDMKKRVEERLTTINNGPSSCKKPLAPGNNLSHKPVPASVMNGDYNRFGFKMRKNDAVDIVSKKQTNKVKSRENKRNDTRSTLKGVRMNRRFELQMQARVKNT